MDGNLLATLIGLLSLLGLVSSTPQPPQIDGAAPATTQVQVAADADALVAPPASSVDAAAASTPLPTAGPIDVDRYAGLWYELARLPVRFQDAASVSTARYGVRDDGTISVENTSLIEGEQGYRIRGSAEPVDPDVRDRLRVSFGGFLSAIPTPDEGNYWIIDVDADYEMALVGTPDRELLWLLARDGTSYDIAQAQALLDRAAPLGFDTTQLAIADWSTRRIIGA